MSEEKIAAWVKGGGLCGHFIVRVSTWCWRETGERAAGIVGAENEYWKCYKLFSINMYWKFDIFDITNTVVIKAGGVCCLDGHLNYKLRQETLLYITLSTAILKMIIFQKKELWYGYMCKIRYLESNQTWKMNGSGWFFCYFVSLSVADLPFITVAFLCISGYRWIQGLNVFTVASQPSVLVTADFKLPIMQRSLIHEVSNVSSPCQHIFLSAASSHVNVE